MSRRSSVHLIRPSSWSIPWLRALVLALVLPLMSAGALPAWARLVGVEGPHVCHCAIDKHDCVCPRCDPSRAEEVASTEALTGRCGDDEAAFAAKALRAVLASGSAIVAEAQRTQLDRWTPPPPREPRAPPPTPPPRSFAT